MPHSSLDHEFSTKHLPARRMRAATIGVTHQPFSFFWVIDPQHWVWRQQILYTSFTDTVYAKLFRLSPRFDIHAAFFRAFRKGSTIFCNSYSRSSGSTSVSFGRSVSRYVPLCFLDAFSHLYKRVCPSVGPPIRPSVRPLVGRSVTHELNFWEMGQIWKK